MERIFASEPGKVHIEFNEKYGGATRYHGLYGVSPPRPAFPIAHSSVALIDRADAFEIDLGVATQNQRLVLFDPTALNHVLLSNCYEYPKPEEVRGDLAMILGKGVLFAEGEPRASRRAMAQ